MMIDDDYVMMMMMMIDRPRRPVPGVQ